MLSNKLQFNYKPVQLVLPVDYEQIIDANDPVVSFKEVVGGLNLAKYIQTSSKGRQEYTSEIMLHLILFGYMENIRSLRGLEKACRNDIRFMYLGNRITPSFMAFQRFIETKLTSSIEDIFYAINQHLIKVEDIDTEILYVDGTKIEANATKFSFVWKRAILNYQEKLYIKITKLFKTLNLDYGCDYDIKEAYEPSDLNEVMNLFENKIDREVIQFVLGKGTRKHPYQRILETLTQYHQKLTDYTKHIEICGERNSYSKTDHDATFMHGKEDYYSKTGIFKPYYNLQIGVSDEYIMHYGVFANPTDTKTWIPFFDTFKQRYNYLPSTPVADAGYGSYDNYMYNLENGMQLSMKYNMFSKEDTPAYKKKLYAVKNMQDYGDTLVSGDGQIYRYSHDYEDRHGTHIRIKQIYKHDSWTETLKNQEIPHTISKDVILTDLHRHAKELLKSEEGITLRNQRSIQVEGAFGDIKANSEYTRIQRRGMRGVQTELCMVLIGYNLRKYHAKKHRMKH